MKPIKLVAVVGPTASGKTALAIDIAKKFSGEIVSCDSMQLYDFAPIATAAPTDQEKAAGAQPEQPCADFSHIEPVQSCNPEKSQNTQQQSRRFSLVAGNGDVLCHNLKTFLVFLYHTRFFGECQGKVDRRALHAICVQALFSVSLMRCQFCL